MSKRSNPVKKESKKDVYARYGLKYESNHIFCEPLNMWINPLIPVGTNTKVGDAGTWSMYHGNETVTIDELGKKSAAALEAAGLTEITGSCPFHCDGCYCDHGFYNFDGTKAGNIRKLILARFYPEFTKAAIMAQIEADHILQCRIHAAGDFFSKEYVDMWKEVIIAFPEVTFWTYTKYEAAVKAFDGIKNVSLVPSITPAGINFGTCSELLKKYRELTAMGYRVHICACGTIYEKHCSDCNTGCKAIGKNCDYVLFIKHSTNDYEAGVTDPEEFKLVCEIIARQEN